MTAELVFRSQMDALAAQDIDAVVAHFSSECQFIDMVQPDRPFHGTEGLRSFLAKYFETWNVHDVAITNLLSTGDRVAAEVALTVSPAGAHAASEESRVIRSSLFDEVVGGLIVCERAYRDPAIGSRTPYGRLPTRLARVTNEF